MQNDEAQLLSYEEFLRSKPFPVTLKEYQMVMNAIPTGIEAGGLTDEMSLRQETQELETALKVY